MASRPDIVFLPGAWHSANCLDKVVPLLTAKGYTTYAHTVKSVGTPHVTVQDDATYIRDEILEPLFHKDRQVVLVVHSYAGTPAAPAIKQLHVKDRKAKGQPGGLVGIIWVTSYLFSSAGFGVVEREAKLQGLARFGSINVRYFPLSLSPRKMLTFGHRRKRTLYTHGKTSTSFMETWTRAWPRLHAQPSSLTRSVPC